MPTATTAPPGNLAFRCQGDGDGGAAAAAALSLILMILGVGRGLSSVSPWSHEGGGAESFGVSTILWLTFPQVLASAEGGIQAGAAASGKAASLMDGRPMEYFVATYGGRRRDA